MRQRGRKSLDAIAVNVDGRPPRLSIPAGLNAKERVLAQELIDSAAPEHFRPTDAPLLVAFVQASLMSRSLARDPTKIASWEKATRTMAALATRLRLSPQARVDPKTVGRMQQPGPEPWHREKRDLPLGFGKRRDADDELQ